MCHNELTAPVRGGSGVVPEEIVVNNRDQKIPVFLARPDRLGVLPAVVVFHDIHGANDFYRDFTRRLAAAEFVAALPDFFVREGPVAEPTREAASARAAKLDKIRSLADFGAVVEAMRRHPATNGKVGAVGFCMGGTFVMLAAARDPWPDAVVAFYGFPAAGAQWPLRPLDEADNVKSPLLMMVGDQDAGVGMDNVRAYATALEAAGKEFEWVIYPGLPHGYMTFDENDRFYSEAQDSWRRTIDFFRLRLSS